MCYLFEGELSGWPSSTSDKNFTFRTRVRWCRLLIWKHIKTLSSYKCILHLQNERLLTSGSHLLTYSQLIKFLFWPNLVHSDFALFTNRDVAAFLLEQEKWVEMLRSSDKKFTTPMRGLISFMPGKFHHLALVSQVYWFALHSMQCSKMRLEWFVGEDIFSGQLRHGI